MNMIVKSLLVVVAFLVGLASESMAQEGVPVWFSQGGVKVYRIPGVDAYYFSTSKLAFDADGAPNAYHPDGKQGLDYPQNAGYPGNGWKNVLVVDPANPNRPYVQPEGEYKGYFVSKTSLYDKSIIDATDPKRYVDANSIPYLVFPADFYKVKGTGRLGDFGVAVNLSNGKQSWFVVVDIGKAKKPLGEISLKLGRELGGVNPSPRNGSGGPEGKVVFFVFPRSNESREWPVSEAFIASMLTKFKSNDWIQSYINKH